MRIIHILLILSFSYASSLFANRNIEWNLAMDWKTTYTPIASTSFKMAQLVKEMSNDRFIIRINGREKHNAKESILKLVQNSDYEMGHTNSSQNKELDINTIWFTTTPFGMTTKEQNTWFYQGNGQKYMSQVYKNHGVLSFPGGNLGAIGGGWFNKEIHSIYDFENLKVEANSDGITNEILLMHGVLLRDISSNELQNSFLNGNLDVINATTISIDVKLEYFKIAPYYYTNWNKPSFQTQFIINKKAFDKLPKNYQTILTTAMRVASDELYFENYYNSTKAWNKILSEYPNIKIKSLPPHVLRKLEQTKKIIFGQYSRENKLFKEIYEDQKKFLELLRNPSFPKDL